MKEMWWNRFKGASMFSANFTAEDVTAGIDGTGLTAIITGASSGIGTETARVLALRGVHVVMAETSTATGLKVKETLLKENPAANIDVMELDLSSLASVRKFATEYKSSCLPLNLLINNAEVTASSFTTSHDNIEIQFATNHLGHFLLTNLLLDTMKKTARESQKEGRIVIVSSEAHRYAYKEGVRFDKINDESSFSTRAAYGQSKLANILHANELAKRLKEDGVQITANSVYPGPLAANIPHNFFIDGVVKMVSSYVPKNDPQGAATICYVALHPRVKGITGEYFSNCNTAKGSALSEDAELAKKLWDFSIQVID